MAVNVLILFSLTVPRASLPPNIQTQYVIRIIQFWNRSDVNAQRALYFQSSVTGLCLSAYGFLYLSSITYNNY